MKQNQWFAVRCCCTPKKVFGFIKMEAPYPNERFPVVRTLVDNMGTPQSIKLMSIFVNKNFCGSITERISPPDYMLEHTVPEVAIYSDDRPIEFWRTIPGFVEAPQTED